MEQAETLVLEQSGGRKGHSTINQATQQNVETETIHLNQQPTTDLYLDLKACFNLMVDACHNLACCHHGAIDTYLHLPARTHQLMHYFVRHKFGVSDDFNTFAQHPWHSASQGAANVVLWYIVLLDILIDAYHTKVAPSMMHDPTTLVQIQCSLKAFINDVVLHATSPSPKDFEALQHHVQSQLQWWASLVTVMGGKLNLKKFCGLIYKWVPDKNGILCITRPQVPPDFLTLTTASTMQPSQSPRTTKGQGI